MLRRPAWAAAQAAHRERVDALVAPHLERRRRGEAHPVEDFLFVYYPLRPGQLRRWHPGAGVVLLDADDDRAGWRDHHRVATEHGPGVTLDVAAWLARRAPVVRRVRDLLAATAARPAQFGCFGLHEWAMVYRLPAEQVRHARWPLRLGAAGTDAVVRSHQLRCTHYDAFRFFAPAARGLNLVQPGREDQLRWEQPGCVHATMDLYKWAYNLLPAVPSRLVADAFELARAARELDMRASPYDLRALGYEPIPIETPPGKAAYRRAQRALVDQAGPLRAALLSACDHLLEGAIPAASSATSARDALRCL